MLASGSSDGSIKLWDISSRREVRTLTGHTDSITSIEFSEDRKTVAAGSSDGSLLIWDVRNDDASVQLTRGPDPMWSACLSPDGSKLAVGTDSGSISMWDIRSKTHVGTFVHGEPVNVVAVSPDGKVMASGGRGNTESVLTFRPESLLTIFACQ
jgi:WD40 repeat protein